MNPTQHTLLSQMHLHLTRLITVMMCAILLMGTFPAEARTESSNAQTGAAQPLFQPQSWGVQAAQANNPAGLDRMASWFSSSYAQTYSVAWGDMDGDGYLDLAVGNIEGTSNVYRNVDGVLQTIPAWTSGVQENIRSVAWGDMNGDGWLDLAVGTEGPYNPACSCYTGGPVKVYRNVNGMLENAPIWVSENNDVTQSVAWGDMNGDGLLDLAVGNVPNQLAGTGGQERVYLNVNGMLQPSAAWTSTDGDPTNSVAWGDMDGDGRLDLSTANGNLAFGVQPNKVYLNQGTTLSTTADWVSDNSAYNMSVAWGDMNGDGALDLAAGGMVYLNTTPTLQTMPAWLQTVGSTYSAWGDVNGDGWLDLAIGNNDTTKVYLGDGGMLQNTAAWASADGDQASSVAWGDMNGDGVLDLATGNWNGLNKVYLNLGIPLQPDVATALGGSDRTLSVAWGDMNGDGWLDLAAGNDGTPDKVYLNVSGVITSTGAWSSDNVDKTTSIAWGDVNGDGYPDLAVGNENAPTEVYLNLTGLLETTPAWTSPSGDSTVSVAWGDMNGDGYLDLAVGNNTGQNKVYLNAGGTLQGIPTWTVSAEDDTTSLAWGDVNGDGALDLALGYMFGPIKIYLNQGGMLSTTPDWVSDDHEFVYGVAWGDVNGDGRPDLAAGVGGGRNKLYLNIEGMLQTTPAWVSRDSNSTEQVIWGDVNGDGALDLAAVNRSTSTPTKIYLNRAGMLQNTSAWIPEGAPGSGDFDGNMSGAWGDMDNDGDLDLAVGNLFVSIGSKSQAVTVYRNNRDASGLPGAPVTVRIQPSGVNANFYATSRILSDPILPITYTLASVQSIPVRLIRGFYSLDGGGNWLPAIAVSGTITTDLTTNASHVFQWDVFASGFFGQSDNVVFRIEAVPAISNMVDAIPGPYLYGQFTSHTFPFRVRGTQVRVMGSGDQPAADAVVYRLPAGQLSGGEMMADGAGKPFTTNNLGYLSGRGALGVGDRLLALEPITVTEKYTVYYANAAPTATGLDLDTVSSGGVQTLTVSTDNPLMVFDISVSLEWDARNDAVYLQQLQYDLRRTAEILYDWTNGQATLGKITVYQQRANWDAADIQILASNRYNPNADQGGVTGETITETIMVGGESRSIVYDPGQLRQGATWNRFGESSGSLGEDWPRAMAHELGHYLLYMDDNYYGFDEAGDFTPVSSCPGAMADPYSTDKSGGYDEFQFAATWLPACENTASNRSAARSDWDTLVSFYPWLNVPVASFAGPSVLPLDTVAFEMVEPVPPTQALLSPYFSLLGEGGSPYQASSRARGVLIQNGRMIDLGGAALDQLMGRGAQPGDRLCLFDLGVDRLGCKELTSDDNQLLTIGSHPEWRPDIQIRPVTSTTLQITVTVAAAIPDGVVMYAQLYPADGQAESAVAFTRQAGDRFQVEYALSGPAPDATLHVWAGAGAARLEAVSGYSLGGNPVDTRNKPVDKRSKPVDTRKKPAPVMSGDGQVVLHGKNLEFAYGEFYILQTATRPPAAPLWATVVGQAYRLDASAGAPSLSGTSIQFYYLRREVPAGEEAFLRVYYHDGTSWQPLESTISTDGVAPYVVAPVQGPGLYVLMSSLDIPLDGPGWNLFAYPVNATRPISEALLSVDGYYKAVYGYDAKDTANPWKVYAPSVPAWVNDLLVLEFGKGYWINMTQSLTLWLKGVGMENAMQVQLSSGSMPAPPATFYGMLPAELNPQADMALTAWVGDRLCGQTTTRQEGGAVVFVVKVFADDGGTYSGCGVPGRKVTFKLDDVWLGIGLPWATDRPYDVYALNNVIYLPLVTR